MSDANTEHTVLSREHARIDSTLDWYFNFAEGDVGLQSNHAATVAVLIGPARTPMRPRTPCSERSKR